MVRVHFKAEYALEFGKVYEFKLKGEATLREVLERLCDIFGKRFRLGVYDPERGELMNVVVKVGLNSKTAEDNLERKVSDNDDIVIWPLDLGG